MHGGCQPGMPVRTGDVPGSGCRRLCLHRGGVDAYREAKILSDEARKLACEEATNGQEPDASQWYAEHPGLTFKQWLVDSRQVLTEPLVTDRLWDMDDNTADHSCSGRFCITCFERAQPAWSRAPGSLTDDTADANRAADEQAWMDMSIDERNTQLALAAAGPVGMTSAEIAAEDEDEARLHAEHTGQMLRERWSY
jgi:hypothetical protein